MPCFSTQESTLVLFCSHRRNFITSTCQSFHGQCVRRSGYKSVSLPINSNTIVCFESALGSLQERYYWMYKVKKRIQAEWCFYGDGLTLCFRGTGELRVWEQWMLLLNGTGCASLVILKSSSPLYQGWKQSRVTFQTGKMPPSLIFMALEVVFSYLTFNHPWRSLLSWSTLEAVSPGLVQRIAALNCCSTYGSIWKISSACIVSSTLAGRVAEAVQEF